MIFACHPDVPAARFNERCPFGNSTRLIPDPPSAAGFRELPPVSI